MAVAATLRDVTDLGSGRAVGPVTGRARRSERVLILEERDPVNARSEFRELIGGHAVTRHPGDVGVTARALLIPGVS